MTLHDVLQGNGLIGKLLESLALRAARRGADDFARSIKTAVEASVARA